MGIRGSKARASGLLPRGENVLGDLVAEGLDAREFPLVPETSEEGQANTASVKISRKIK